MILTLQQFKYAVVIADKGNISKAAQKLFISQPSFTNSMKELENEPGVAPDLIRLSVGIESADDIIADIEQALKCI